VNKDEIAFFKGLSAQRPLAGFEDTQVEADYLKSTYQFQGLSTYGLHFAYLLNALAISLPSSERWMVSQLALERHPDKNCPSSSKAPATLFIHHASLPQHVKENTDWIQERLEYQDSWLKYALPKTGKYPYYPSKSYEALKPDDFPSKVHGNEKVFIDHKEQLWLWDRQEKHWDVQYKPYGRGNYFRVAPDGRLLD